MNIILGSTVISGSHLLWVAAALYFVILAMRGLSALLLGWQERMLIAGACGLAAIAGARLHGWAHHAFLGEPSEGLGCGWSGPYGTLGGYLGLIAALYVLSRAKPTKTPALCQALFESAIIAAVIGRYGCYLNGCCVGKREFNTEFLAWLSGNWPLLDISAALGALLVVRLSCEAKAHAKVGWCWIPWWLMVYGLSRCAAETLRVPNGTHITMEQVLALFLVLLGLMDVVQRASRRSPTLAGPKGAGFRSLGTTKELNP